MTTKKARPENANTAARKNERGNQVKRASGILFAYVSGGERFNIDASSDLMRACGVDWSVGSDDFGPPLPTDIDGHRETIEDGLWVWEGAVEEKRVPVRGDDPDYVDTWHPGRGWRRPTFEEMHRFVFGKAWSSLAVAAEKARKP